MNKKIKYSFTMDAEIAARLERIAEAEHSDKATVIRSMILKDERGDAENAKKEES